MDKKKVIVYGLGDSYKKQKKYIESKFEIIAYSDSNRKLIFDLKADSELYIIPEDIQNYKYDFIYVTSSQYYKEIKRNIIELIGNENGDKVVSVYDVFGDFRNSEVKSDWVINKLSEIGRGKKLLDAGAGSQRYRKFCDHLEYVAQDFAQYIPNEINVGLQNDSWEYRGLDIICDIINMPLDNEVMDVILCTEVFEHLKNPILALKEFNRILKQGGTLILTAPFCCLTHMAPYFFYNGFSEFWYREYLEINGFEITEIRRNGNFFKYLSQELFRVENMAEKYCSTTLKRDEIDAILKCVNILTNLSEVDSNSNETLCFGYMLTAEKVRNI
ncbi:MAG: class I SAM-dependent methyltransferase [Lachnospiraceae bacterium]|jgi:ubiquinone/menaquinone biosynthesis C-methylase UbiE|nr:class I SAM-dependent methyltransferase [Lachnospiraceae bacterium]